MEIEVDGMKVTVPPGTPLIVACEKAGVEIPRFCYHERLAIAGNCRMCLVEVEKVPKPVASCAYPVSPNMKVKTNTPMVKKAREGVMEFLLANHPLDCPICDQAGECDLQDQSMAYGQDRSRLREVAAGKRAVEDKNFGPLVKTSMNRCIHCTRCVRFATEVAGAEELGTSGRGNDMQIGMYVEKILDTELSGNIVDLCPVGALTAKPYEFTARPWELRHTESVDVHDALGSNIRIDSRGNEVMRILPRVNEAVNEEWIADKTRYSYDGLKRQRLTNPLIRVGDSLEPVSWETAFDRIRERIVQLRGNQMTAVAGQLADAESIMALKDLFNRLGSDNLLFDGETGRPSHGADLRASYSFNSTLAGAEFADLVLLVGTNPRHEAPLLQSRFRKSYVSRGADFALIGEPAKLTVEYDHLGTSPKDLYAALDKKHPFAKRLAAAKRPMIVVGADVANREDGDAIFAAIHALRESVPALQTPEWNGVSVLQRSAARTAALDLGFTPGQNAVLGAEGRQLMFLLGADDVSPKDIPAGAFVVYQGHHGDVAAHYADVILPGAAYTEKVGTYVNTEGRAQRTRVAVSPPGNAREDWQIIRALSEMLGLQLPYDDAAGIGARIGQVAPHILEVDSLQPAYGADLLTVAAKEAAARPESLQAKKDNSGRPFALPIKDYYLTDAISRSSRTMAKCSATYTHGNKSSQAAASAH